MKFTRNVRIIRGYPDPTPFASVFFCMLIFVLLASLVYTPGVQIRLPESSFPLAGVNGPAIAVAMDKNGQLYFQNHLVDESELQQRLRTEVSRAKSPLTLVVQADRDVTLNQLDHLRDVAAGAGIKQISQQVLPRLFDSTNTVTNP